MADGAGLAGIISGTDPMAPVEMRALQTYQMGQQAQDTSQWANQGIWGALGRGIAAARGSGAADQLQQITQARMAALPDLAAAYASDDPYKWAASNASANPMARWAILSQTPDQVAATKQRMAETALKRAELPRAEAVGGLATSGGLGAVPTIGGGAAPGAAPAATPTAAPGAAPPTTTAAIQGAPSATADPLVNAPAAGAGRLTWLAGLPPAQQKIILARLRAQQQPAARL
jgi:hypothetical protein